MAKIKDDTRAAVPEKTGALAPALEQAAPINQLALAKQQVAEAMGETKKAFKAKFESLVEFLSGLDAQEIEEIITDAALRPALKALKLQVASDEPEKPSKPAKKASKGRKARSPNKPAPTDDQILKFLAAEKRKKSELVAEFGSKVIKKLEEMAKSHSVKSEPYQGRGKASTVYEKT